MLVRRNEFDGAVSVTSRYMGNTWGWLAV